MLLRLCFVVTVLHQGFVLQLFLPYNILLLNEILENQKNYVTVKVNLAQTQKLRRIFFWTLLEYFSGFRTSCPCLTVWHTTWQHCLFSSVASMVGDNSLWFRITYVAFIHMKTKSNSLKKDTEIFAGPGQYNQWEHFTDTSARPWR